MLPAHVVYPLVDSRPAGFSPAWRTMLRKDFGFEGVIFSDDLPMEGASVAGGMVERAEAAWGAGCDVLLVCNAPDSVSSLLENWRPARLSPPAGWRQDAARYAAGKAAVESLAA